MFNVANVSRFMLAAAIATVCGVLLLSPSSCPSRVEVIGSRNVGTQADPSITMQAAAAVTGRPGPGDDDLALLLRSAAMEDNTVIMTFTNKAWTAAGSLMDLLLESFRIGENTQALLKHLIIVAVDGMAFEQCKLVHPLCYSLDVGAVNMTEEKKYMSKDYLEMMWVRNKFQTRVLELGYAFVFTDMDIVWFRNALLQIPVGADITISSDKYNGDVPYGMRQAANGGFLYAKPNARTVAFFKGWYEARTSYPNQHDQYVFDRVKEELSLRHGASVHFVDTAYFGGFCQPKKDFRRLCTFHGNCLVGLGSKLNRLRGVLDEWKKFRVANNITTS